MNTRADSEGDAIMPAGLRGLWDEAREWVAWLVSMFDGAALRTTGVNRTHGARLSLWLLNIEGAVRRLIFSAALAFTPPAPRQTASRQLAACASARTASAASVRRAGFCVFRLCGAGQARPHATFARKSKSFGHIPFPADPLLSLGSVSARPQVHSASHGPRARNPLDRWGRLSRQDPDWRPAEETWPFLQPSREPDPHPRAPRPQSPRDAHDPNAFPESLRDWRRHHDEWQKPVPAPDLAARLEALAHVIANPSLVIARAARRLHDADIIALARNAGALPAAPRRAAHIATAGHTEAFARRCHTASLTPDTS